MKMGNCSTTDKKDDPKAGFFDWRRKLEETKIKELQMKEIESKKQHKPREPLHNIAAYSHLPSNLRNRVHPRNDNPSVTYHQEAIERMRFQLKNDPNSFLLNNLMLSVQFFDNYDRVLFDLKNNSISPSDVELNDNMAQHHKQAFLPDKLQEAVDNFVQLRKEVLAPDQNSLTLRRRAVSETKAKYIQIPLQLQRMFVVHDNIEVVEPDDVSNYDTVKGVPYYKMLMEESDEPGFVKLRKMEIIGNDRSTEKRVTISQVKIESSDSDCVSDESDNSSKEEEDEFTNGMSLMNNLKTTIDQQSKSPFKNPTFNRLPTTPIRDVEENTRRPSGILKNTNAAVVKGQLSVLNKPKKTSRTKKRTSVESGYRSSNSAQTESSGNESDYGYATITNEATPKRLEMSQKGRLSDSTSIIPSNCLTSVKVKRTIGKDRDEDYGYGYSDFQQDLYKSIDYLNSNFFVSNFKDMFLMKLYQPLGFSKDFVSEAMTQGASIYCNTRKGQTIKSFEVIPAVNCGWPVYVQEWQIRPRRIITNPRTNFSYQWPTQDMVIKARGQGCFIVPLGFRPTRGINPQKELQWRLTFPKVERYLETCMAHSQVRCYLFTSAMFRLYIENEASTIGLNTTHIKNYMFWQLEDNYAKWPEDRLGEATIRFLQSLYEHIKKSSLPDYIIPECNLLKGIPSTVLLKQQRQLRDIIEFPVMHLLICLKNFKYLKPEFYPVLDYKRLYKILTSTETLQLINPGIPKDNIKIDENELEEVTKGQGFWQTAKTQTNPEYAWQKEYLRQQNAKKAAEIYNKGILKNLIEKKKKILEFDLNRRRLVLEFFIPHFISMAEWSINFGSGKQAMIYLEQAKRLAILMKDDETATIKSEKYLSTINEQIEYIISNNVKPGGPRVPKRNESIESGPSRVPNSPRPLNLIQTNTSATDYPNLESPTRFVFADVHHEMERPKIDKSVTILKLDEESEESDVDGVEESRL